jgi:hypothetical protein
VRNNYRRVWRVAEPVLLFIGVVSLLTFITYWSVRHAG